MTATLSAAKRSHRHPTNPVHIGHQNSMPIFTCRVRITYRYHIHQSEIHHLQSSTGRRPQLQQPHSQRRSFPVLSKRRWPPGGGKGWTTDDGCRCMLRTDNHFLQPLSYIDTSRVRYVRFSFLDMYLSDLSEDWRRSPHPTWTADDATYAPVSVPSS
ncbi:hypothetical protein V8E53_007438 [Lactarius tabidus]|jgi:hypothetical protein